MATPNIPGSENAVEEQQRLRIEIQADLIDVGHGGSASVPRASSGGSVQGPHVLDGIDVGVDDRASSSS